MTSAAIVTTVSRRHERTQRGASGFPWYFTAVAAVFAATTVAVITTAPTGLMIAFGFIVAVLSMSLVIRAARSDELRTLGFEFVSPDSKFLWDSLRILDFPILVPHRPGALDREKKEQSIRSDHNLDPAADVVFLEIEVDDPSNFFQRLLVEVFQEDKRYIIRVRRCCSVAHAIAAIALEMSKESKPPGLHFGWTEMDLLSASWSYLALGEGNIPSKVHELIQAAEPDPARRPRVIVGGINRAFPGVGGPASAGPTKMLPAKGGTATDRAGLAVADEVSENKREDAETRVVPAAGLSAYVTLQCA
jgi:hypothetical protein